MWIPNQHHHHISSLLNPIPMLGTIKVNRQEKITQNQNPIKGMILDFFFGLPLRILLQLLAYQDSCVFCSFPHSIKIKLKWRNYPKKSETGRQFLALTSIAKEQEVSEFTLENHISLKIFTSKWVESAKCQLPAATFIDSLLTIFLVNLKNPKTATH